MRVPFGEYMTDFTFVIRVVSRFSKIETPVQLVKSQRRSMWSSDPETMRVPSGENATDFTALEWPLRVAIHRPLVVSQSRSVQSRDPETKSAVVLENETDVTLSECP
jgi:hypothetical protein